jgi:hypothetical protein
MAVINLIAYFKGRPDEEGQRFVSQYTLRTHMVQESLLASSSVQEILLASSIVQERLLAYRSVF